MEFTYAETFSCLWSYSYPGVRFDSGVSIRNKRHFLHRDNSRVWMAHCRRDCRVFWQNNQPCKTVVPGQFDGYVFVFFGVGISEAGNASLARLRRIKREREIRKIEMFSQIAMDNTAARYFMGQQDRFVPEECKVDVARQLIDCPGGSAVGDEVYRALSQQIFLQGGKCLAEAKILLSLAMVEL